MVDFNKMGMPAVFLGISLAFGATVAHAGDGDTSFIVGVTPTTTSGASVNGVNPTATSGSEATGVEGGIHINGGSPTSRSISGSTSGATSGSTSGATVGDNSSNGVAQISQIFQAAKTKLDPSVKAANWANVVALIASVFQRRQATYPEAPGSGCATYRVNDTHFLFWDDTQIKIDPVLQCVAMDSLREMIKSNDPVMRMMGADIMAGLFHLEPTTASVYERYAARLQIAEQFNKPCPVITPPLAAQPKNRGHGGGRKPQRDCH